MYMHMERMAASVADGIRLSLQSKASLGISEQLETLQERSFGRRKRSDRSESDEAVSNHSPHCSGMCYQVLTMV